MKNTLLLLLCCGNLIAQTVGVSPFAAGLETVTQINHAGDSRLFVTEATGNIKIVNADGSVNDEPFLTIPPSEVTVNVEQGLLGTTFHPDYSENGYFYISYVRSSDEAVVIKRFTVSADPNIADADSGVTILEIPQVGPIHLSGNMAFGPDKMLYIASGDSGTGGAPSQWANNYHGKILRIDVDSSFPYSIPPGNAFTQQGQMGEIFMYGLRNPWKFSFDRLNGDLWLTDVGQANVEEVNHIEAPLTAGHNFGWPCYEGTDIYPTDLESCPDATAVTMPSLEYRHIDGTVYNGCSITGGYIYRGSKFPALYGTYFFGDYCRNQIATRKPDGSWAFTTNLVMESFATSFGEDVDGELYVAASGQLYKILDQDLGVAQNPMSHAAMAPNPARDELRLSGMDSPFSLAVSDAAGRLLASSYIDDPSGNLLSGISLKPGIYFFRITEAGHNERTFKIIKE